MPLPDERPRASVANLIGRFENKTRPSSAPDGANGSEQPAKHSDGVALNKGPLPKSISVAAAAAGFNNPLKDGGSAPSWLKPREKKDTLPKETEKVNVTPAIPTVVAPVTTAAAEVVAEPESIQPEPPASDDAPPNATSTPEKPKSEPETTVPSVAPGPSPPKAEPSAKSANPGATAKPNRLGNRPHPPAPTATSKQSTARAKATTSAAPNKLLASVSASSLNKSKSTPSLKSAASTHKAPIPPPSPAKSLPPKDHPTAAAIRPQHTGSASTTSSARRPVVTARSKTPSGVRPPKSPPNTRPKLPGSGALYAPTASSLAKMKTTAPATAAPSSSSATKKPVAHPPSSFSNLTVPTAASAARARSGSSGNIHVKPNLPSSLKSSVSASGNVRRMVSAPKISSVSRDRSPARPVKTLRLAPKASPGSSTPTQFSPPRATHTLTSEEELIVSGATSAPQGSNLDYATPPAIEPPAPVVPEPQILHTPESGSGSDMSVKIDPSSEPATVESAVSPSPEQSIDSPPTSPPVAVDPEPERVTAPEDEPSELEPSTDQDQLEDIVSMLHGTKPTVQHDAFESESEGGAVVNGHHVEDEKTFVEEAKVTHTESTKHAPTISAQSAEDIPDIPDPDD